MVKFYLKHPIKDTLRYQPNSFWFCQLDKSNSKNKNLSVIVI